MPTRRKVLKWSGAGLVLPLGGMLGGCGGGDANKGIGDDGVNRSDTPNPVITGDAPLPPSNGTVSAEELGYAILVGTLKTDEPGIPVSYVDMVQKKWRAFSFVGSKPMAVSIEGTATALAYGTPGGNNQYLFTGGYPGGNTQATAQAQVWSLGSSGLAVANVGAMGVPRIDHIALPLTDGKVLIAGGRDASLNALSSMEVYDPASRSFSPLGATMSQPRAAFCGVTLVSQNAVNALLFGGGSADLYNVGTGVTSTLGSNAGWDANIGRPAAVSLGRDQALMVGCTNPATFEVNAAWRYDGSALVQTQNLSSAPRGYATATLLSGGKVLVAGGVGALSGVTATTDLYDPLTNSFTPGPNMATARCRHMAILLPDNTVLIAGGDDFNGGNVFTSAEIYDPVSNSFKPAPDMPAARNGGFLLPVQGN